MGNRSWSGWLVAAVGLLAASGCSEPRDIVPVYPPGMTPPQPQIPAGEGAQALGEQAPADPAQNKVASGGEATSPPTPVGQPRTTPSGLIYETLKEGDGEQAKTGQNIRMHYTGTFEDGKMTIFASLQLTSDMVTINQVWQNGPLKGGTPAIHATSADHLASKGTLNLVTGATG